MVILYGYIYDYRYGRVYGIVDFNGNIYGKCNGHVIVVVVVVGEILVWVRVHSLRYIPCG